MVLVASETGHVYTYATKKLQPMITSESGKALIQTCLNSPDPPPATAKDVRMSEHGYEEVELSYTVPGEEEGREDDPLSIAESRSPSPTPPPAPPLMTIPPPVMAELVRPAQLVKQEPPEPPPAHSAPPRPLPRPLDPDFHFRPIEPGGAGRPLLPHRYQDPRLLPRPPHHRPTS